MQYELLVGFLSVVASVVVSVATLAYWLGKKFAEVNVRFKLVDERFKSINERFNSVDEKFKLIDERFRLIDERFNHLEKTFKNLLLDLAATFKHAQEFTIEMLSYEGVLRREAAEVLKSEVFRIFNRFSSRLSNPLTREELRRIREFIEKKELTYEEALEFRELADKLVKEYAREYPELWKVYWYAVFWVGASLRLRKERALRGKGD